MNWIDELRRVLGRLEREDPAEDAPAGIACHEAAERIFEWLDGELDPELSERVGGHLETCARCYPRLLFERAFREALVNVSGETAPKELEERILRSLQEQGYGPE